MADRLDKFISENSSLTRSEAKKALSGGRVTVNGLVSKKGELKVTDEDEVALDGKNLKKIGLVYVMLNKPAGVISATEDSRDRTVLDLIKENREIFEKCPKNGLFPIGRLDKDTEGLLVISNDGQLSHNLLSPTKHVEKEYIAECEGTLAKDAAERFEAGLQVGDEYKALPAKLTVLSDDGKKCTLKIVLTEGRFHQVKRMCHEVGAEVVFLKRISFGKLVLPDDLKVGEMRFVCKEDITGSDN
ncbi:MAG: 16S rRNA pseudouridine(516) synthase [Lachnospiraceae bacterium]|nr:16S rRNA pseudouridine(516) synthase [Lachnospiraceae bacterium]